MPRILADLQLLEDPLARQAKTFFFPRACGFVSAHRRTRLGRLVASLCLLRLNRLAFPSSGHVDVIIVLRGLGVQGVLTALLNLGRGLIPLTLRLEYKVPGS